MFAKHASALHPLDKTSWLYLRVSCNATFDGNYENLICCLLCVAAKKSPQHCGRGRVRVRRWEGLGLRIFRFFSHNHRLRSSGPTHPKLAMSGLRIRKPTPAETMKSSVSPPVVAVGPKARRRRRTGFDGPRSQGGYFLDKAAKSSVGQ